MTIRGRHGRVLAVGAAGAVLATSTLGGALLAAPQASAQCSMTPADDQYIKLLAQNKMTHSAGVNDCNVTAEGRWLADQVRTSADPYATAKRLVQVVDDKTSMDAKQAEWEVETAIYVYAPDMIPKIKNQAAQQAPA
ncbi:DUF732 domain-containing protein [Mycobacterium sp. SMC-2]|uniref:hypothetical protein n=1 Tax=Mycobacterium sp. SMC-2 TaxID=2857058 RepID=UPI0021B4A2D6|nr:hypothetical protein [Mycobacterium sp. SMC-2]UXA05161.1 DUF732 domain-containing protein [Mycobacterium sp. SMC-2]